jgi:hypothetical protein
LVESFLLVDIDGLRPDVLSAGLEAGRLPNIARMLGGDGLERGLLMPLLAPAPSITFTSQACLVTGAHPDEHGIPGNQFFDRFGTHHGGLPRHYAFDVGDTLAADDAVRVFTEGLAAQCLLAPTFHQITSVRGMRSVSACHMYALDASLWLKPSLTRLARFTKGGNLFGLSAPEYDRHTLQKALDELAGSGMPDILTVYFMGLDHESHVHGPQAQAGYLAEVLDPLLGELWDEIESTSGAKKPAVLIFSDHGQIGVPADDLHSIRLGFPFEREMGHLFDALGLDVHDFPGEDPNCDAVVASNGGLAHVYLQNRLGRWADAPIFERDVLPVGRAFWEAHASGIYAAELHHALAGVFLRDVEHEGWGTDYLALTPQGDRVSLEAWFAAQPAQYYADPVNRLHNLAGPLVGDLLLVSNYASGYYFSQPMPGVHGGLHPEDSWATLALGCPGSSQQGWEAAKKAFVDAVQKRCQLENNRQPSTADLLTGLFALMPKT